MAGFFYRPGYYDPSLLAGIDPMTGLIPFDPPTPSAANRGFDPSALLAALGPQPPGMPTDSNALMALLRDATQARQPASAVQPDFLQTIQHLLTGAPLPGMPGPGTATIQPDIQASADAGAASTVQRSAQPAPHPILQYPARGPDAVAHVGGYPSLGVVDGPDDDVEGKASTDTPSSPNPRFPVPARPADSDIEVAADNQRENKMVRDIVVQLNLSRDQQQLLHRAISGQGHTYQEVLQIAKDMFGK
jgi:hypothetical protein